VNNYIIRITQIIDHFGIQALSSTSPYVKSQNFSRTFQGLKNAKNTQKLSRRSGATQNMNYCR